MSTLTLLVTIIGSAFSVDWVSIDRSFDIGRTEVTVAEWRDCAAAGACSAKEVNEDCNLAHDELAQHPINCVTFAGAEQFCSWASGRICSNNEWLKACGTTEYPYGPWYIEDRCNIHSMDAAKNLSQPYTAEVGSFSDCQNPAGIFDLAGNVAEWVESGQGDYSKFRGSGAVTEDPERYGSCKGVCAGNKKVSKLPTVGVRCCRDRRGDEL